MQDASLFPFIDTAVRVIAVLVVLALPFVFPGTGLMKRWKCWQQRLTTTPRSLRPGPPKMDARRY